MLYCEFCSPTRRKEVSFRQNSYRFGVTLDSIVNPRCELMAVVFLSPPMNRKSDQAAYNSSTFFGNCPVKLVLVHLGLPGKSSRLRVTPCLSVISGKAIRPRNVEFGPEQ